MDTVRHSFSANDDEDDIELAVACSTPLRRTADSSVSPRKCCQCCGECCCDCCGCEKCCRRCQTRCTWPCCQRCCLCSCRRTGPVEQPVLVTWSSGLRHVIDDNVVLGCMLQYRSSPSCLSRWLLMLLFLTTAVFIQYAEEAMGPICVREYLAQCPPFQAVAKHGLPMTYINQAPPAINFPEGVAINDRRLYSSPRKLEEAAAGSLLETGSDRNRAEMVRDSLLENGSRMFGSWQFDCHKPMCDIFYPQMIDWLSLWRLTNSIWGHSNSHKIPITSEAVILGYCKCEGPAYDGIINARVSGGARSIFITLILQTALPKIFRAVFMCVAAAKEKGSTSNALVVCHWVTVGFLLILVVVMAMSVFLLKFDPAGWRKALALSAVNAAITDPCVSFAQILFCIRMDWPLKCCGCGPPTDIVSAEPRCCGHRLESSRVKAATGVASDDDFGNVRPSQMGKTTR